MPKNSRPLLLDTHCWLWVQTGDGNLSKGAMAAIEEDGGRGGLLLSAISIWELSMLVAKRKIVLRCPLLDWVYEALKTPGLSLVPLSPEIAVESTRLPTFHGDPADRIILASARHTGAIVATRDRAILEYSKQAHVSALAI